MPSAWIRYMMRRIGIIRRTCLAFFVCLSGALKVQPCAAQQSILSGSVLADPRESPLINAEIQLIDLRLMTRSDSAGKFRIDGIPFGKHRVAVRLIGYESIATEMQFKTGEKVEVDFVLRETATTLSKVEVKAEARSAGRWAIKLHDFEERRKAGIGKFLTAEYFESKDGRALSSFIQEKLSGVRITQRNGRHWLASTRGCGRECPKADTTVSLERMPPACYLQIVVNGMVRFNSSPGQAPFDLDELNSTEIIGFELYSGATTPLQYRNSGKNTSCGTAIIWTK